jgi:hypothetical protein
MAPILTAAAGDADALELGDAAEVDQRLGRGQAQLHRGQQRLAAGDQLGAGGRGPAASATEAGLL